MPSLDLTSIVGPAVAAAREAGQTRLLVVVSAENCAGCERLADQLDEPAVQASLRVAAVVHVNAGDLYGEPADHVALGGWSLQSPGFPITWVFEVEAQALSFSALAVGPLDHHVPEHDVASLLGGESVWVHEAGGLTVQACAGDLCVPIRGSDDFRASFSIPWPDPRSGTVSPRSPSPSSAFAGEPGSPAMHARPAPLPVVLVGAGQRATAVWGPLLRGALADRLELVGLASRSPDRRDRLAERLATPAVDLDEARRRGARAAIVAVSSPENAAVAHELLEGGFEALLLETPLALSLADATALRDRTASAHVAIAEQNPHHPEAALLAAVLASGALGRTRLVTCDRAGYRYHAAAVARAWLGRPTARTAFAQRVTFPVDFGRGVDREALLTGTVGLDEGVLFQFTDGEAVHLGAGPWPRGAWSVACDGGGWRSGGPVVAWAGGVRRELAVVSRRENVGGVVATVELAVPELGIQWRPALPGAALDDDAQAAARCALEWLDGRGWSRQDAWTDLSWIATLERSAALGGVRLLF